jgi:UDP-N-acetyl-D-galactosamine dehydrogenase
MGKFVAEQTIKQMIAAGSPIKGASVHVLGLTFKEDCADLRNSKVIDVIRELRNYGVQVQVADSVADAAEAAHEYGVTLTPITKLSQADAVVVAVAHHGYRALGLDGVQKILAPGGVVIDVKACLPRDALQQAGFRVWRL